MTIYVCCKPMFQVFQVFRIYVSSFSMDVAYVAMVIHICFKCFRCFRLMLQVFHLDVAKVDLDVAKSGSRCCKSGSGCCMCCYGYTRIFVAHVSSVHLFQTYVTNVSSGCFKSRSDVAQVAMAPVDDGQWLSVAACCC
jgi:hypothetical protein